MMFHFKRISCALVKALGFLVLLTLAKFSSIYYYIETIVNILCINLLGISLFRLIFCSLDLQVLDRENNLILS